LWKGTSAEDSAWAGRPSTWGKGRRMRFIRGERCGGILGSLSMFLGVEMKETV
jgi:hypothetical protein